MVLGGMDLPSSSPTNTIKTTPQNDNIPTPTPHHTSKASPPFSNAATVLKPLLHHHHHVTPHVTYCECLKNHAASIGGHALDGCGEFMPSPATSLTCAACGCHRNFHRRDGPHLPLLHPPFPLPLPLPPHRTSSPSLSPGRSSSPGPTPSPTPSPHSPPPVSHLPPNSFFTAAAPAPAAQARMLLALGGGGARNSGEFSHARKRFRTKFSQEQKERMCLFAEKVGWKMQRGEEKLVEEFCSEIGVRKGVLKVWMHNNKHTLGKRDRDCRDRSPLLLPHVVHHNNGDTSNAVNAAAPGTNGVNGGTPRLDEDDDDDDDDADDEDDDDDKDHEDIKPALNCFANGSSSSS